MQTKTLPAPNCIHCGKRIGYNQREKAVRSGKRRHVIGWRHEKCVTTTAT